MDKWIRAGKTVNAEGTTIEYRLSGSDKPVTIESRKRHIPHAGNRGGTWDHTTYHVILEGKEVRQCHSLQYAKMTAEKLVDW